VSASGALPINYEKLSVFLQHQQPTVGIMYSWEMRSWWRTNGRWCTASQRNVFLWNSLSAYRI